MGCWRVAPWRKAPLKVGLEKLKGGEGNRTPMLRSKERMSCHQTNPSKDSVARRKANNEREKSLELSTSTLGRLRSTN